MEPNKPFLSKYCNENYPHTNFVHSCKNGQDDLIRVGLKMTAPLLLITCQTLLRKCIFRITLPSMYVHIDRTAWCQLIEAK